MLFHGHNHQLSTRGNLFTGAERRRSPNPLDPAKTSPLVLEPGPLPGRQEGHLGRTFKRPDPPIPSPKCLTQSL